MSLLFDGEDKKYRLREAGFPKISYDSAGFKEVLKEAEKLGYLGLDYEFREIEKPTIMGVATLDLACGLKFDRTLHRYIADAARAGIRLVAHSGFGADKPVFDAVEGFRSPVEWWDDSMLLHWFENSHLTKAPGKDESDDAGALGFMDLWTSTSLVAAVPNWKICRGSMCYGPCPTCDVRGYCAIDAWAGLKVFLENREKLIMRNFPWETYEVRCKLAAHLEQMERTGVCIDRKFVSSFGETIDKAKEKLFPLDEKGEPTPYNPRSSNQVLEYFSGRKVKLSSNTKEDVEKALKKICAPLGYEDLDSILVASDLPENAEALRTLFQYKDSGKGPDAWFSDKYYGKDGFVHPRFIYVGTSTGRLSCAKPNFTNIPRAGWGALIKAAVIPHDPENFDIVDADLGQLELRGVLHQGGYDLASIQGDAIRPFVVAGGSNFDRAAALSGSDVRTIVKTVVYGGMYGEGLRIYTEEDLKKPMVQREIAAGAVKLYTPQYVPWLEEPWEYCGGVVGFTASNLAERLFGNKEWKGRKTALEIQDDIIFAGDLKIIRKWQIATLKTVERYNSVTLPNGQFLRLNGSPESNAKVGLAFMGQGYGSIYAQASMMNMIERNKELPLLQVHDSLVYAVRRDWTDMRVRRFMAPMFEETSALPGFRTPGEVKRGRNYGKWDAELNPGGLRTIWNSAKETVEGIKI